MINIKKQLTLENETIDVYAGADSRYWIIPPEIYEPLNNEFHFNFDPCPYPFERDGINPDVDDAHSMKIYKHREREWMKSVSMVDKGVKFADLPPQKTLDVYFYPKGKNMHKSAKMEVSVK